MDRPPMVMSESGLPARPRRDNVLLFSNIGLAAFTVAFVVVALSVYKDRISATSLKENHFATAEWRLLEEMKARTDQQLLQKDQEIADLNRVYLQLYKDNASQPQLLKVKGQLQQAEAERKAILARSISAVTVTGSAKTPSQVGSTSLVDAAAFTVLLQNQVETLQTQLDGRLRILKSLEKERSTIASEYEQAVQTYIETRNENMAKIAELSATISQMRDDARAAQAAIDVKARETGPATPLAVTDLNTQALVRALVGSPEIRTTYPDLLKSLDHFLDAYALQQRLKGRREAYAAAASIMEPLGGKPGPQ